MFFVDKEYSIYFTTEEANFIQHDLDVLDCIFGDSHARYSLWSSFDMLLDDGEVPFLYFELLSLVTSLKVCALFLETSELRDSLIERLSVYIEENS